MSDDDITNLYEIIINQNLIKGDLIQITFEGQPLAQYVYTHDQSSVVGKLTLTQTTFGNALLRKKQ